MCVYCMIADWGHRWMPDDYFRQPPRRDTLPLPQVPPTSPFAPFDRGWPREMLDQFEDILKRVKEMEDKLGGCPCEEPEKMDFLKAIRERLDAIDKKIEEQGKRP